MSYWKGNDETCPVCGLTYRRLRTGMTYPEVRMLLWVGDEESEKWKYKRRHTVLGLWWSIKQSMWIEHLQICERTRMYEEAQAKRKEEIVELQEVLMASDEQMEELLIQADRELAPGEVPSSFYVEDDVEVPF